MMPPLDVVSDRSRGWRHRMNPVGDIARLLAERVEHLVADLLPLGHREGHEWRCGNVIGEAGQSLGVHLTGAKRGIWCDFSTGQKGDALDLVVAVLGLTKGETIGWAKRWLGLDEDGAPAFVPARRTSAPKSAAPSPAANRWAVPWRSARPIAGTPASTYLQARGLRFDDPRGDVLRFTSRHARRNPESVLEHHPALLALLRDVRSGEPCGIVNIYLRPDGLDRIRDKKGKTSWGRAAGAAVMLDDFADVTYGLVSCEGVETAIALHLDELRPVWALAGAGNLAKLPVLSGVECLTVAADNDRPGQQAADEVTRRWRCANRQVLMITPSMDDWAEGRAAA